MINAWCIKYRWTGIVSAVIAVLLLVQMPDTTHIPILPNIDKVVHFCLFAMLATVTMWEARKAWIALVWAMVWGGLLELMQQYLTSCRSGDWTDWAMDVAGAVVAVAIVAIGLRKKRNL